MSEPRRIPAAFRLDEEEPAPKRQARKPSAMAAPKIRIEPEDIADPLVASGGVEPAQVSRAMHWGSLLVSALFGLVALWVGLETTRLIEDLFARSPVFGWIGTGLAALAGLAALMFIVREIVGLMRLSRLGTVREDAAQALLNADARAAGATIGALKRIYDGRRDLAWALARMKEHDEDVIDPADRVRVAELDLVAPLDEAAGRLVAVQNLKMLREVATLYGGRPGIVGTLRLARMVVAHLAAAGALAMSDQLVQQVVGQGVLGRLSARFGEGAVNGILTARIGLAAIDVCRPLPFTATSRPGLAQFLTDVMRLGESEGGPDRRAGS